MRSIIEMALEADIDAEAEGLTQALERFASLVLAEREKQQEPVAFIERAKDRPNDFEELVFRRFRPEIYSYEPLYTTPPTTAQDNSYKALELVAHTQASMKAHAAAAARQMRDAAVKVCEDCVDSPNPFISATATLLRDDIAALPLPGETK